MHAWTDKHANIKVTKKKCKYNQFCFVLFETKLNNYNIGIFFEQNLGSPLK